MTLVGYRGWKIPAPTEKRQEPILMSIIQDTEWTGPVIKAHNTPKNDFYHVGIYCTKKIPQRGEQNYEHFSHQAYGEIELLGCVIEHEWGYRAEQAVVRSITIRDLYPYWPYRMFMSTEQFIKSLENRYECEVSYEFLELPKPLRPEIEEDNVFVGRINFGNGPFELRIKADKLELIPDQEEFYSFNSLKPIIVANPSRVLIEGYRI